MHRTYIINTSTLVKCLIKLNVILNNTLIIIFILLGVLALKNHSLPSITILYLNTKVSSNATEFINNFWTGFFKIHPILFYLSLVIITSINSKTPEMKLKVLNMLNTIIAALILGSLWALYQFVWGYLWSNDSIEYTLIFIGLIYFLKLHASQINKNLNNNIIILTLLLIFLVRSSLIFTKHSFFANSSTDGSNIVNSYLNYIVFCVLLVNIKFKLKYKLKQLKYKLILMVILVVYTSITFNTLNSFYFKKIMLFSWQTLITISLIYYQPKKNRYVFTHLLVFLLIILYNTFILHYLQVYTSVINTATKVNKELVNNNNLYYKNFSNTYLTHRFNYNKKNNQVKVLNTLKLCESRAKIVNFNL